MAVDGKQDFLGGGGGGGGGQERHTQLSSKSLVVPHSQSHGQQRYSSGDASGFSGHAHRL